MLRGSHYKDAVNICMKQEWGLFFTGSPVFVCCRAVLSHEYKDRLSGRSLYVYLVSVQKR